MRLDKYLSELQIASRTEIKEMIRRGRVKVNGNFNIKPDLHVTEADQIEVDGRPAKLEQFEYYVMNKPAGYLTAREDRNKPVVMSLVPSKRKDLSPVGRLDEDTEGILLITNDGLLNHQLLSPKNHVKKKYYAELDKPLPDNAKEILEAPIEFQDFTSKPGEYEKLSERSAYLTITEGKFHQVKRMFWKVGCEVTYLKRVSFGPLELKDLPLGEVRKLTEEELRSLKSASLKEE